MTSDEIDAIQWPGHKASEAGDVSGRNIQWQPNRICIICQGRQSRYDGLFFCTPRSGCPLDELAIWEMELLELMKIEEADGQ